MTYEILHNAMLEALKTGKKDTKNILSGFIAQIQKAAIDKGCRDNITESFVDAELLKIKKSIQEQIDTCPASRPKLLERFNYEMEVVNLYAPTVIADENLIRAKIIQIVGGETLDKKQRGMVMKEIKSSGAHYDMATVNKVIEGMLAR